MHRYPGASGATTGDDWGIERAAKARIAELVVEVERLRERVRIGEQDFSPEMWEQVLQEKEEAQAQLREAWEKLKAAEREVQRWYGEYNRIDELGAKMCTERDEAREKLKEMQAVVRQMGEDHEQDQRMRDKTINLLCKQRDAAWDYAVHRFNCMMVLAKAPNRCTCGLDAILKVKEESWPQIQRVLR